MPGPPRRKPWTYRGSRLRRRQTDPRHLPTDHGGRCAVIIAAYRAAPFIEECLDSIREQLPRSGWEYSVRIGVDGCISTHQKLLELGVTHWMSDRNGGPYLMRNSLIELLRADAYAIFDADDVMYPHYLLETLARVGRNQIAGAARDQLDARGRVVKRRARFEHGVCTISDAAWRRLGGYRPWPIVADHDLIVRARALRIPVWTITEALYGRRQHPESLTQKKGTGLRSSFRMKYKKRTDALVAKGSLQLLSPATTKLRLHELEEVLG